MPTNIRLASPADVAAIHQLIRDLAIYEKAEKEHTATQNQLHQALFGEQAFVYCLIAEENDAILGISLFYFKYSTWKGKSLYLEDLVVKESHRKTGIGSQLFKKTIGFGIEQNAGRMDWQVLDWNHSAIAFYKKFNATLDPEWINGFFTPEQMKEALTIN